MLEFIKHLTLCYQRVQSQLPEKNAVYQASIEQLCLIESFLHKGVSFQTVSQPLQLAVIGPTQSGKSTLVNRLLNQDSAGVSPLAGYTVHPQGFLVNVNNDKFNQQLAHYFEPLKLVNHSALNRAEYDCYSLDTIVHNSFEPCVIWDTPDFDSLGSGDYQRGMLKTLALADVLILVVSKEKYADQSVWELLKLVEPLNQPVFVVLNKLLEDSQDVIIESFKARWKAIRNDVPPRIYPLFFSQEPALVLDNIALQAALQPILKPVKLKRNTQFARQFIDMHWDEWVLPLKMEQAAKKQWQLWVDEATVDAVLAYQRDYLEHPQHYDTFQNALAELLTLLEIPILAKTVMQSRKVLTWPLRKLFKLKAKQNSVSPKTQETLILHYIAEHLLLQLTDKVLDQIDSSQASQLWWKQLNKQLRQDKVHILDYFQRSTLEYHHDFKKTIESTAATLYEKLAEHPALLNGLRAMRVTTDALLLALMVQAGGIGLHDLLLAPAMLSVSSYLAESAVGGYIQRAETDLKQQQLQTVKHKLFIDVLQQGLLNLPTKLTATPYFNISVEQLAQAEAELKTKPHGLRIF